jgi:hypothetical protein
MDFFIYNLFFFILYKKIYIFFLN